MTKKLECIEDVVDWMLIISGVSLVFGFVSVFLVTGILPVILFTIGSSLGFSSAVLYDRLGKIDNLLTSRGNG